MEITNALQNTKLSFLFGILLTRLEAVHVSSGLAFSVFLKVRFYSIFLHHLDADFRIFLFILCNLLLTSKGNGV